MTWGQLSSFIGLVKEPRIHSYRSPNRSYYKTSSNNPFYRKTKASDRAPKRFRLLLGFRVSASGPIVRLYVHHDVDQARKHFLQPVLHGMS